MKNKSTEEITVTTVYLPDSLSLSILSDSLFGGSVGEAWVKFYVASFVPKGFKKYVQDPQDLLFSIMSNSLLMGGIW